MPAHRRRTPPRPPRATHSGMPRIPRLHWLLATLFLVTGWFQIGELASAIARLRGGEFRARIPFPVMETTRQLGGGPYRLWQILSIDGTPFNAAYQLLDLSGTKRPGDTIALALKGPQGETKEVTFTAGSQALQGSSYIAFVATSIFLPVCCFLLGFAVAAIRVRDPLAWLLLALLLSFAEAAHGSSWDWPARDAAVIFHGIADYFPLCLMLFGIWFPHRLRFDRRAPWAKWLVMAPIVFLAETSAAAEMVWLHDIDRAIPFHLFSLIANRLETLLGIIAVAVFFGAMLWRSLVEREKDARRRVALLWAGASIGLAPAVGIVAYALATGQDTAYARLPDRLRIFAYVLLPLFPLTLAYVIVVQRAMNLRVVIRLGMQYALLRGGLWVLRAIVLALGLYALLAAGPHQTARLLTLAFIWVVLQRGFAGRISRWMDRRFFREAWDAERVLGELSEEARQFTSTAPLLETVTNRVARTLHIPRASVLLPEGENYCLATAADGFDPAIRCLPTRAIAIEQVRSSGKAAVVYFDDANSWVQKIGAEEKRRLQALDAQVLLPLSGREHLAGVMVLGPKSSEEPYSGADLRLLQSVASQTGLALENCELLARLSAEAARRERLNRDLEIATEVQQRLFPQDYPAVAGVEYYGACRPALGIGGDYYDFVQLRNGKLGIAIGDVSGKGVAAALLMSNLHASLRGQTLADVSDLAALMRNINQMMYEASTSNRYATFFYGEYCPATRRLAYVNAGHNAPMLLRGDDCLRLEATGPVVGLLRNADYAQDRIDLASGDLLVGFTDGISEAMTVEEEEWEEDRLLQALRASQRCGARAIVEAVFAGADAFTKGATQYDDMTLVTLKIF